MHEKVDERRSYFVRTALHQNMVVDAKFHSIEFGGGRILCDGGGGDQGHRSEDDAWRDRAGGKPHTGYR